MNKESGQALLILLLATLVALTVSLSITQRTISDVATSTKIEETSRAFSAAEAALNKVVGATPNPVPFSTTIPTSEFGNQAQAFVQSTGLIPVGGPAGLEYPPIDKTAFAQFWLANPANLMLAYDSDNIEVYFGNEAQNTSDLNSMPAVEVNVIVQSTSGPTTGQYFSRRVYLDSTNQRPENNFVNSLGACDGGQTILTYNISSVNASNSTFYCHYSYNFGTPDDIPILARVRVLYSEAKQKVALVPAAGSSLPGQAVIYTAQGTSGPTERKLALFTLLNVVPFYFDFALFSTGSITK